MVPGVVYLKVQVGKVRTVSEGRVLQYYVEDIEKAKKEAWAQGETDTIIRLITAGLLTLSQGAAQLNLSEDKLKEMINAKQ